MEITSFTTQSGAAGMSAATTTGDTGVINSDFETFLVMLTAQLQNQDPLNPMDSSDYAVQLATFSGVEQQVLTNELLRGLGAEGRIDNLASVAGWVGLEAGTQGTTYFTGAPVDFDVDVPERADWAQLVIRADSGAEIAALAVAPGSSTVTWDGAAANGAMVAAGTYKAELHHYTGGEGAPVVSELAGYARIVEVRQGSSGIEVVLQGGRVMAADEVSALRSPPSGSSG